MPVTYRAFLGQRVKVIVDRPLGTKHPRYDMIYPVNYGYLPGTLAGDGMPIDAYILGIDKPIHAFEGIVTAVIWRHDDVEYKLVVIPAGMTISDTEIRSSLHFQEQYFESDIIRSV
jgi:inorganic pyrophosphatase